MGLQYIESKDSFLFDFKHNNESCIIEFNDLPLTPIEIGADEVYYFGYQFKNNDYASSKIRTKFFNALRFDDNFTTPENKRMFVVNALKKLHKQINVYNFDVIVYPKSRSKLNQYILKLLGKIVPNWEGFTINLIKKLPSEINFDWKRWERDTKESGKFVNEAAWKNAKLSIEILFQKVKKSEYFSIAESVKKNKYKSYFTNYLYFEDIDKQKVVDAKNILIVDDVSTTGATLLECVKSIRILNQTAPIVIFTLIGKKEFE